MTLAPVGLRQHRGPRLLQDLQPREVGHLLGHVDVADATLGVHQVRLLGTERVDRVLERFETAPNVPRFAAIALIAVSIAPRLTVPAVAKFDTARADRVLALTLEIATWSKVVPFWPTCSVASTPRRVEQAKPLKVAAPIWRLIRVSWVTSAVIAARSAVEYVRWSTAPEVTHALQDRADLVERPSAVCMIEMPSWELRVACEMR